MGYRVVAISRGPEKEMAVKELGAHGYIDSGAVDAGAALRDLGYAKLILTTAMATDAMAPLIKGIGIFGKLVILSVPENGQITVNSNEMIMRGISVQSWPVGNCHDSEKAIKFAHFQGVNCAIETFPLERAQEAFGKHGLFSRSFSRTSWLTGSRKDVEWASALPSRSHHGVRVDSVGSSMRILSYYMPSFLFWRPRSVFVSVDSSIVRSNATNTKPRLPAPQP
jgi:hypothetical protein